MKCQPAVDREKLKKIVLYECIEKSFGALEEACKKIPPADDWYLKMVEAEHAYNALHLDQARQEAIVKKYGTTFQRMSDALFSGTTLKTTLRRPSDAIIKKSPEKIPAGLENWCASCASVAIRDTFGRLASIMVGGKTVETANPEDTSYEGRLRKAYNLSRAIVGQFSAALAEKGIEKSDVEIQTLVNELMLRCCGEVSFLNIATTIRIMTGGMSIQEVDLTTFRPGFTQFRFSVDEKNGSLCC